MKKNSSIAIDFDTLVALTTAQTFTHTKAKTIPYAQAAVNLVRSAVESGMVDCQLPVGEEGYGILYHWERKLESLPGELLEILGRQDPLLGPIVNGQSVFQTLARDILVDNNYQMDDFLSRWSLFAPLTALGIEDPQNGAHAFSFLATVSKEKIQSVSKNTWKNFIENLAIRGVNWQSPAYLFGPLFSVNLIGALVEAGIDTSAEVKSNGQKMPLWQVWSQSKDQKVNDILAVNGSVGHDGQEIFQVNKYLSRFADFVVAYGTPSARNRDQLWEHLVSRSDWHQVCDENGKSALFHAVQADPGILRYVFDEVKSPNKQIQANAMGALQYHDPRGWGLWFYLLPQAKSNAVTNKLVEQLKNLIGNQVSLSGKGWRFEAAGDLSSALRAWQLPGTKKASLSLGESAGFDEKIWISNVYTEGWHVPENVDTEKLARETLVKFLRCPSAAKGLLHGIGDHFHWARAAEIWTKIIANGSSGWMSDRIGHTLMDQMDTLNSGDQYFPIDQGKFQKQLAKILAGFGSGKGKEKEEASKTLEFFERLALKSNLEDRLPEVEETKHVKPRPRM